MFMFLQRLHISHQKCWLGKHPKICHDGREKSFWMSEIKGTPHTERPWTFWAAAQLSAASKPWKRIILSEKKNFILIMYIVSLSSQCHCPGVRRGVGICSIMPLSLFRPWLSLFCPCLSLFYSQVVYVLSLAVPVLSLVAPLLSLLCCGTRWFSCCPFQS